MLYNKFIHPLQLDEDLRTYNCGRNAKHSWCSAGAQLGPLVQAVFASAWNLNYISCPPDGAVSSCKMSKTRCERNRMFEIYSNRGTQLKNRNTFSSGCGYSCQSSWMTDLSVQQTSVKKPLEQFGWDYNSDYHHMNGGFLVVDWRWYISYSSSVI